jgi:hypothetical protein
VIVRLAVAPIGGDEARRAAQRELGRPEYHRDDRSLLERALDWIADRVSSAVGGHSFSAPLLILAVLVLAVVAIALWRAGAFPGRRRKRRAQEEIDPLAPQPETDHAALAERLEAEGRLAEALREWLRAAVQTLEDRAVLDPVPGRTGTQTARQAAERMPDAAGPLTAATSAFEQVWFGGRPATPENVAVARQAASAVTRAPIGAGRSAVFAVPR